MGVGIPNASTDQQLRRGEGKTGGTRQASARFRQTLARLGCDHFETYEQVGANWAGGESTGRFVQIMRFRDRKQQQQVQEAERTDPAAQTLIKEFCELINFPYQQQQGLFAVGYYSSVLAVSPTRVPTEMRQRPLDNVIDPASGNGDRESENPEEPTDSAPVDPSIHHS